MKTIRLPALKFMQGETRTLYSFAIDGKDLHRFTTISRIARDSDEEIQGYQRPEVISHINEIRSYLESYNPMIPNAIVIAFDKSVTFEATAKRDNNSKSQPGILIVPVDAFDDHDKPGWIVDGQQRTAAIRDARIESFPICVVGFVAETDSEQREQFILVNSTKPLPKGLIYELLPSTDAQLPSLLQKRRFPALLLDRLNQDELSPFHKLIRTPTNPYGVIADNSILKMIENSLVDGALYHFRELDLADSDVIGMLELLHKYWTTVSKLFPKPAWGESPRKSRLMHGAGIVCMGFLMDTIAGQFDNVRDIKPGDFKDHLYPLKDDLKWTSGMWEFGPDLKRRWDEIQNLPRDIYLLTDHIHSLYKSKVLDKQRRISA